MRQVQVANKEFECEKHSIPAQVVLEKGHRYLLQIVQEQRVSTYPCVITSAQVGEPITSKQNQF